VIRSWLQQLVSDRYNERASSKNNFDITSLMISDWQLEHLIKLQRTRPELVQRALEKMMAEDEELRWSLVVSAYLDESISLARAASLLGMHPIELRQVFLDKGIPVYLGPESLEDARAEVEALFI